MELFLNLLWLAVVSLLVIQIWKWRALRTDSTHGLITLVFAVLCIAALMFPAISMSDDLHLPCMISESPAKRVLQLSSADQSASVFTVSLLLLLIASLQLLSARVQALGLEAPTIIPLEGFLRPSAGRAPPIRSL